MVQKINKMKAAEMIMDWIGVNQIGLHLSLIYITKLSYTALVQGVWLSDQGISHPLVPGGGGWVPWDPLKKTPFPVEFCNEYYTLNYNVWGIRSINFSN